MALTQPQLNQAVKAFMVDITGENYSFQKPDLAAAAAAVDAWADANAAGYNAALPTAFRTTATAAQKSGLLALVLMLRGGRQLPEGL